MIASCHFEVVDADDRTVGSVRFGKAGDAQQLMAALVDVVGAGSIAVAEIVERVIVERQVTRLEPGLG